MDLYIQVGVLLLFLSALSLFIYIYSEPATIFVSGLEEKNDEITKSSEMINNKVLFNFDNRAGITAEKVKDLITQSASLNITVLLQTTGAQHLAVSYGYRLSDSNYSGSKIKPTGRANSAAYEWTAFEESFVTPYSSIFYDGTSTNTPSGFAIGQRTHIDLSGANYERYYVTEANKPPVGSKARLLIDEGVGKWFESPHVMFSHPAKTVSEAKSVGQDYYSTGRFYTDQSLRLSQPPNVNTSYLNNPNSVYYLNPDSRFLGVLIEDLNGKIVGVYLEETTVDPRDNVLMYLMQTSGNL